MPSNREISAILEFCRQTSDNVIQLKNELASVIQQLTEMKEMMVASNNTGRSFCNVNQSSFSIYQDKDEVLTAPTIQCPLPSQLDSDKPVFDQRVKHFTKSWLKDAVVVNSDNNNRVVEAKLAKLNSYKEMIVSLGPVAVDMMTKDLDLSDVNWPAIAYRNLPNVQKKKTHQFLRSLYKTKNIPSNLCINSWLEEEMLKHFYHSKRQARRKRIS